jgi:hypothetical protein
MDTGTTRPAFPYLIGAAGAALFALGATCFAITIATTEASPGLIQVALLGLSGGGLVLGVAWIAITAGGLFKGQHGGLGAIAGSLAVPAAMMFGYLNRGNWEMARVSGIVVVGATAAFAIGHAFVRGPKATRVVAAIAAVPLVIELVRALAGLRVGPEAARFLGVFAAGGLAAIGVALLVELPALRRPRPPALA